MPAHKNNAIGSQFSGAPEAYYKDARAMGLPRLVKPEVDVWSLGCVLFEAAVWLLEAKTGLQAFRDAKNNETRNVTGFQDIDAFHDGEKVS